MTYPAPRYLGENGEIGENSATLRRAEQGPELVYPSGTTVHYLATGATTDGRYGLFRWELGPEPSGPGPHFHRSLSESFFVLAGTVRIYARGDWVDAHPGDFVHVPEGGIHGFRNESGAPASMLLHFAPGAPRERYFEEVVGMADTGEAERAAFFLRHDNHWV